jgi:hypothetical protein
MGRVRSKNKDKRIKITMAETENLVFKDPSVKPNKENLFSILGNKGRLWQSIMKFMHENYPDVSEEWKYYNDGKRWLFRMNRKKKTIFWIGVLQDTFIVTFYFGDKAESWIESSSLPEKIKGDFKTAKRYGKIRGISTKMADEKDVDNVLKLAAIKLKVI